MHTYIHTYIYTYIHEQTSKKEEEKDVQLEKYAEKEKDIWKKRESFLDKESREIQTQHQLNEVIEYTHSCVCMHVCMHVCMYAGLRRRSRLSTSSMR